jgi:acetyl esterase/lipase
MDIELVAPELREATLKLPRTDPGKTLVRLAIRIATRVMPVPRIDGVTVSTVKIGSVRIRCYRPVERGGDAGLFWIHGGGLLFGDARQDDELCAQTARALNMPVYSANDRFAPEHPFPAAHQDVYTAWHWLQTHAADFGVDPRRVVIGGESAGAGLAAALVQRLHDEGGNQPIAQWLFAPMLDDRTCANESLDAIDHWVWNNRANRVGWTAYLRGTKAGEDVPAYAVAARRADLSGLAPTYLAVGDIELFLAENLSYAARLEQAGVAVTLDVVPGAPHGFENWAAGTAPAQATLARARGWLTEVLAQPEPAADR